MGQGQRVFLEVLLFGLLASGHLGSVKVSLKTNNPELPHFRQVSADHHLEDENFATLRYSQEASQHSSNKDICSPHVAGQEGHGHEGLVLEKTYILVTSEQGRKQQETFHRYLTPPISCNYTSSPFALLSYKTRIYPEVVQVYKHLGKGGKLGTNHFEMLPSSSTCGEHDLSPSAILKMIKLGEYLFKRYHKHLPVLQRYLRKF
ncbi:uncharacterized protein LOC112556539 [Pomacea canaliculata]|uniref:uncharacterized protein LOC112556539 n=1 Tax=Pomacea canaliculata TaxID=400727 RepID=UPI000D73D2FF|nr:uncharacterized protein LOC112556539 [Pomacea canaliculata]